MSALEVSPFHGITLHNTVQRTLPSKFFHMRVHSSRRHILTSAIGPHHYLQSEVCMTKCYPAWSTGGHKSTMYNSLNLFIFKAHFPLKTQGRKKARKYGNCSGYDPQQTNVHKNMMLWPWNFKHLSKTGYFLCGKLVRSFFKELHIPLSLVIIHYILLHIRQLTETCHFMWQAKPHLFKIWILIPSNHLIVLHFLL